MRGIFVWKADNSNSVRRMSNINENLLANIEANQEKSAKMTAIKDFDESKLWWNWFCCFLELKLPKLHLPLSSQQSSVASTAPTTPTRR